MPTELEYKSYQYTEGRVRSEKAISHSSAWSISIEMLPLYVEFRPLNPHT